MTFDSYVKGQLLAYAIREGGRHGGTNNALAVAQVLSNRVRAGWQGGDWLKVIRNAPAVVATRYADDFEIDPRGTTFRILLASIDSTFAGAAANDDLRALTVEVGGPGGVRTRALYYCELDRVHNPWFKENVLQRPEAHPRLAQIGPVTFFG